MSKVYIVQNRYTRDEITGLMRPRFNTLPVKEFGVPVEILDWRLSPLASAPTLGALRHALRNYSDEDYILPVGTPAFLVAAGAIAAQHNNGRVHVLHWDAVLKKYFPFTIDVNHRQHEEFQNAI